MDLDLPKAAVAGVDEAAVKLEPELTKAIDYLIAQLKTVLVGRKITITVE